MPEQWSSKIIQAYQSGKQQRMSEEDRKNRDEQQKIAQQNFQQKLKEEQQRFKEQSNFAKEQFEFNRKAKEFEIAQAIRKATEEGTYNPPGAERLPSHTSLNDQLPVQDGQDYQTAPYFNKPGFTDAQTGVEVGEDTYRLEGEKTDLENALLRQRGQIQAETAGNIAGSVAEAEAPFKRREAEYAANVKYALQTTENQQKLRELKYKHNLTSIRDAVTQDHAMKLEQFRVNGRMDLQSQGHTQDINLEEQRQLNRIGLAELGQKFNKELVELRKNDGFSDIIVAQRASELELGIGKPLNNSNKVDQAAVTMLKMQEKAPIVDPKLTKTTRDALAQQVQMLKARRLILGPENKDYFVPKTGLRSSVQGAAAKLWPSDFKGLISKQQIDLGPMVKASGESAARFTDQDAKRWNTNLLDPSKGFSYNKQLYDNSVEHFKEYVDRNFNALGIRSEEQKQQLLKSWGVADEYNTELADPSVPVFKFTQGEDGSYQEVQ